ncbi:MAG: protein translocase subunit SecF [Thermoanaerobaculaceae bacterium]|nr:protein translocase subunit SecF [Thermoanaerobaculaceae bacterium]
MRFFHNTHIQFMKYRWHWIAISTALNLIALGLIFFGPGFKYGVDFAGGTQLTVKFKSDPDVARLRRSLENLNLGAVTIQRFDEPERHELLIRLQSAGQEGDFSARMITALDKEFNAQTASTRLNLQGVQAVRDGLVQADPDSVGGTVEDRRAHYEPMASGLLKLRKEMGILNGPADLDRVKELSSNAKRYLADNARFGEFSIMAADSVGPAVGKDLRTKASYAVGFSLLGMLVYIWVRFKFQYGVGAIVALVHDTLIALGVLSLTGREIDIPTIAALLTLVGYSVNDTVIIFDRIRERIKLERGKPLIDVMNSAINQTLSRTVITSGLTELVVIALFLFGGDVINTFSFVLLFGIVVGTYSSIYIASPITLGVSNWLEKRKQAHRRR